MPDPRPRQQTRDSYGYRSLLPRNDSERNLTRLGRLASGSRDGPPASLFAPVLLSAAGWCSLDGPCSRPPATTGRTSGLGKQLVKR